MLRIRGARGGSSRRSAFLGEGSLRSSANRGRRGGVSLPLPTSVSVADSHPTPLRGSSSLRVAGLFAGIGGLELGLHRAGHQAVFLCESDPGAVAVLRRRFPTVPMSDPGSLDVRLLESPPNDATLLTAGFPCQ